MSPAEITAATMDALMTRPASPPPPAHEPACTIDIEFQALGACWTLSVWYNLEGFFCPATDHCPDEAPEIIIESLRLCVGNTVIYLDERDLPDELLDRIEDEIAASWQE